SATTFFVFYTVYLTGVSSHLKALLTLIGGFYSAAEPLISIRTSHLAGFCVFLIKRSGCKNRFIIGEWLQKHKEVLIR
ncbi:hypothetical protein ACKYVA_21610, partial [Paenibacillus larvae]